MFSKAGMHKTSGEKPGIEEPGGMSRREALGVLGTALLPIQFAPAPEPNGTGRTVVDCSIYPAIPDGMKAFESAGCRASVSGDQAVLENGFARFEISRATGTVEAVENRVTGERYEVDDSTGFEVILPDGALVTIPGSLTFSAPAGRGAAADQATLNIEGELEGTRVTLSYQIRADAFWIERSLTVNPKGGRARLRLVSYGRLRAKTGAPTEERVLRLGKFDRPRLLSSDKGGLFGGVGWWFYDVGADGVYENRHLDYEFEGEFHSQPWYLGVFRNEEAEPYRGWLWYKSFLEIRKGRGDRRASWSYWNAGWGQWGIDIDDRTAAPYIDLIQSLGIRSVAFGSGGAGLGINRYVQLLRTAPAAVAENARLTRQKGIEFGFLDNGGLGAKWEDETIVAAKLELLDESVRQGIRALHFDFFKTSDTFRAHHNVARYFRAAARSLDYTECHLGMADYGPQFQRLVLVNHPTDVHGFDISHFSSDWATFLAFRQSRREWQARYDNLMPEYGLYYFLTHYANWGHPRRYTDPEPQQFLYGPHAYCGIAYNFHDLFGFRRSIAAASAFTPFFVFGHLELRMPEDEASFARSYLRWAADHADLLRPARISSETDSYAVVSKIRDGKGPVFLLNYGPMPVTFRLHWKAAHPVEQLDLVFPERRPLPGGESSRAIEIEVPGESVVILDVNRSLRYPPPSDQSRLAAYANQATDAAELIFRATELPTRYARQLQQLPRYLSALDNTAEAASGILDAEEEKLAEIMKLVGRGPLPQVFRTAYGFEDDRVETWKVAPWASGDRVWLVLRPEKAVPLARPFPRAIFNGGAVPLIPRVDYRAKSTENWSSPLFYADVTRQFRKGRDNRVLIEGIEKNRFFCYLASAGWR